MKKMKISIFLHFYQPYNQQKDILLRIVNESYLPITRGLLERPHAKVIININAALTELLIKSGFNEVIDNIVKLADRNQVELTSSAKYHAFLPLLPREEIIRQINQNDETNREILGNVYNPEGFFTPELAVNDKVMEVIAKKGYKWISVPQVAHPEGNPDFSKLYRHSKTGVNLLFRNKRVSAVVLSAMCRDVQDLIKETKDLHEHDKYWFLVMDAETFGHHRVGHEKLLFEILDETEFFEPVRAVDLLQSNLITQNIDLRSSTWTNEEQDFWIDKEHTKATTVKSFILWKDPSNPIHKLQWKLTNLAIITLRNYKNEGREGNYKKARNLLDKAISSDQYWWASAKPWWSLEMIEQGAYQLKTVFSTLDPKVQSTKEADNLYRSILDQAFEWQRSGYIRKMHSESSGTFMKKSLKDRTPPEWYNQLVLEFEKQMNNAADKQDFEKAIKWRDAVLKIGIGTDKYDILHVVDELWMGRNVPWAKPQVKPFLEHSWDEFTDFAKKNFIFANTREDFEYWKKNRKPHC